MSEWPSKIRRWLPFAVWAGVVASLGVIAVCTLSVVLMPRLLVGGFLSDVRAGRTDQAYRRTSQGFQSYVSRDDFPGYLRSHSEIGDANVDYTRGVVRQGKDCRENQRLRLEVGVWRSGEESSHLVFVWEDGWWKFNCVSVP